MEQAHSRCSACAEIAGDVEAPGGVIHDDGMWLVLLRKLRVLRNPTPAARADAAKRIRQLWRA